MAIRYGRATAIARLRARQKSQARAVVGLAIRQEQIYTFLRPVAVLLERHSQHINSILNFLGAGPGASEPVALDPKDIN